MYKNVLNFIFLILSSRILIASENDEKANESIGQSSLVTQMEARNPIDSMPTIEEQFALALSVIEKGDPEELVGRSLYKIQFPELLQMYRRNLVHLVKVCNQPELLESYSSSFISTPSALEYAISMKNAASILLHFRTNASSPDGIRFFYICNEYRERIKFAFKELGIVYFPIVAESPLFPKKMINLAMRKKIALMGIPLKNCHFDKTPKDIGDPDFFARHDIEHGDFNCIENPYKAHLYVPLIRYLYKLHSIFYDLLESAGEDNTDEMQALLFEMSHEGSLVTEEQENLVESKPKRFDWVPTEPDLSEELVHGIVERSKIGFSRNLLSDKFDYLKRAQNEAGIPSNDVKIGDITITSEDIYEESSDLPPDKREALEDFRFVKEDRKKFDVEAFLASENDLDNEEQIERDLINFLREISVDIPLWTAEGEFNDKEVIKAVHAKMDNFGNLIIRQWKKSKADNLTQ